MDDYVIREYKPGEPSLVCYFYYKLYEDQYKFKPCSEKYFLKSMCELFDDPKGSQMWIIEQEKTIVGSIAVIKRNKDSAQLRLFAVDIALQGKGLGNQLMNVAMNFCKKKGYKNVNLWTIDILKPARHLYAKFGFEPNGNTVENTDWADYPMLEEEWVYHGQ